MGWLHKCAHFIIYFIIASVALFRNEPFTNSVLFLEVIIFYTAVINLLAWAACTFESLTSFPGLGHHGGSISGLSDILCYPVLFKYGVDTLSLARWSSQLASRFVLVIPPSFLFLFVWSWFLTSAWFGPASYTVVVSACSFSACLLDPACSRFWYRPALLWLFRLLDCLWPCLLPTRHCLCLGLLDCVWLLYLPVLPCPVYLWFGLLEYLFCLSLFLCWTLSH